jgi:hypothetical protein
MATIGADPEFFFRDVRTGMVTPVIGVLGGTKKEPLPIPNCGRGMMMQEDNVMAEFNIPPAMRRGGFTRSIRTAVQHIGDFVRTKLPLEPDVGRCSRLFSYEQLDHQQARVFGCSADHSAHEQGRVLPAPSRDAMSETDGEWRCAGGHVHIGYENPTDAPHFVAAALCDVYLGLPSVGLDKQGPRRTIYGTAGRYRPTPYGIEYRTLSNFWIWDSGLCDEIYTRAANVGALLEGESEDELHRLFTEIPWHDVCAAINNEDEAQAADLLTYLRNDVGVGGL